MALDFLKNMFGKVGLGGEQVQLPTFNKNKPKVIPQTAIPPITQGPSLDLTEAMQSGGLTFQTPVKPEVKSPTVSPQIPPTPPQNSYQTPAVTPEMPKTGSATPQMPRDSSQNAPETPKAPVVPQVSPETQKALESAESAYKESIKVSADELSTQEDIDKLMESTKTAYRNVSGQAIPLEFITGQLKSIEQRALGLAEPLERKLARLQAKRTGTMESSKFALDRLDKQAESERKLAELRMPKTDESFTLSPGQIRYDASGKMIASGGEKPLSQAYETASIAKSEKEVAAQQSASQSIGLVNSLLTGDRYKAVSGAIQTGSIPFFGDRAAVNEYDQLQGLLKLGIRGLLKGQGQISDYEGKILGQAASSLSRLTSESQTREALLKIRGVLRTNNGQETEVIVKDKTGKVVGKGMLNGQDIYEAVNDGNSIEYL